MKDAEYYADRNNLDKVATRQRWAKDAVDKAKTRQRWAKDAKDKAKTRLEWARDALKRLIIEIEKYNMMKQAFLSMLAFTLLFA